MGNLNYFAEWSRWGVATCNWPQTDYNISGGCQGSLYDYGVISKGVDLATKSKTRGHQKQECKFAALQVTTNSYTIIKIRASGLM